MGILTSNLQQDATIISTTIDDWGDLVNAGEEDVKCRFRKVSSIDRTINAELYIGADAMAWFDPNPLIVNGTVLLINGVYYRITRIIEARRMGAAIEFIKAFLQIQVELS